LNTDGASIRESIEQVELRPARVADAADMAALLVSQRSFMAPFDPPRGEEFYTIEGQRREFEQLELAALAGTRQRFLIRDAGDLVGWVSVTNIVRGPFRSANLGYAVAQEVNGRGIATYAVGEVCRWAFTEAGLHRLEAGTLLDNHGSQRVLAKNEFERIGVARNYLFIDGEWRDHILFQRVTGG
jgi:ribosomal-protein-alanine N-acetyltransferase